MKRYYDDMEDWKESEEPSWLEAMEKVMGEKMRETTEEDFGLSSSNYNQSPLRRTLVLNQDGSKQNSNK